MTVFTELAEEDNLRIITNYLCFGSEQQQQFTTMKRSLLQPGFHKIVLQGSPGMGKTFLVDSIFRDEDIQRHYDVTISASISGTSHAGNLRALYTAIWKTVTEQQTAPANSESRLNALLRKELSGRKVLLAINDVQTSSQAEQICTILGGDSSIIITSSAAVDFTEWTTCSLTPLSIEGSGRLLLTFALPGLMNDALFRKVKKIGIPTVDKVVQHCNGVPLVLKIAGASVTTPCRWVLAAQLIDTIPKNTLNPMLHVCYQLLAHELVQQCLLDMVVAPKHHEWSRSGLLQFWQHSRQITASEAKYCEEMLLSRQMLERCDSSRGYVRFRLPGLLRSFAEDIVIQSGSVTDRLRLCQPGSFHGDAAFPAAWQVASKSSFWGTAAVTFQATLISLMDSDISVWQPPSHYNFPNTRGMLFSNCLNLRKLKLRGAEASLRSLDLKNCTNLESLPEHLSHCGQLRYLNLKNCGQLVELPTFNKLVKLRALNLEGCGKLKALPKGLEHTTSLQVLNLRGCTSLPKLPKALGYCPLSSLPLQNCNNLACLPDSIHLMTSLQTIIAPACISLAALPDGMSTLVNLKELDFRMCSALKTLGSGLGGMTALEKLTLTGCVSLTALPDSIGELTRLTELDIRSCCALSSVPQTISNLTQLSTLSFAGCSNLSLLPADIGALVQVTELDASESRVSYLPDSVGNMASLRVLNLENCRSLKCLPDTITKLIRLEVLTLHACGSLTSLPEDIHTLTSLQHLSVSKCNNMMRLPASLPNLPSLQRLSLSNTALMEMPPDISRLTSLTSLSLANCAGLLHLPPSLGSLSSLSALNLRGCTHIRFLPPTFCSLSSLQTLLLDDLPELCELPVDIASLFSLKELSLSNCPELRKLPQGISSLTTLETLCLANCHTLSDLPAGLTKLKRLRELDLAGCSNLTTLPKNMGRMTSLEAVYLWASAALSSFSEESGLPPGVVRDGDLQTGSLRYSPESVYGFSTPRGEPTYTTGPALFTDTSGSSGFFSTALQDVAEEDEEDLQDV